MPQCDRVLVLRAGKLLALAPWHELAALQLPELVSGAELMHEEEEDERRPAEAGQLPTNADAADAATVSNVSNGDGAAANGYDSNTSDGTDDSSGSPGRSEVIIVAATDAADADDGMDGGNGAPAISEAVARRPTALRAALSRLFAEGPGAAGGTAARSSKQRGRSGGGGNGNGGGGGPYDVGAEDGTNAAGGKDGNDGAPWGDSSDGVGKNVGRDADGKGAKEGGTDEIGKLVSAEERQQGCDVLMV